jgi:hypothetical protein
MALDGWAKYCPIRGLRRLGRGLRAESVLLYWNQHRRAIVS